MPTCCRLSFSSTFGFWLTLKPRGPQSLVASGCMQTRAGSTQSCGAPDAKFLSALHATWSTQSNQDLQLGLISNVSSSSSFSRLWFSSPASLHLLPIPRPSSLVYTKTFTSCSHQERHGLDARSQARLNPIPTAVSMGSHPPALLSWTVIICLPLGFFLFLPFETEFLLPFESARSSCALPAKT